MNFSIIIPAKNAACTISRALDSIVSQSHLVREVFVIDDHSRDDTATIVKAYADSFDYIKIYASNGLGVSAARNMGMDLATGDYLIFVDADDYINKDALQAINNIIDLENSPPIVTGGYIRIADDGDIIRSFSYQYIHGKGIDVLPKYLNKIAYTHLGAFCFKKQFLLQHNIRFQNFDYAEDILFISESLFYADDVVAIKKEIYSWTLHRGSVLYTNTLKKFGSLDAIEHLKEFFANKGFLTRRLDTAIGNHYAMLLLDTVTTLLWMGRTVEEIEREVCNRVKWDIVPCALFQAKNIRKEIFLLKYFRKLYLSHCKKHFVPYNFRKRGIEEYDG